MASCRTVFWALVILGTSIIDVADHISADDMDLSSRCEKKVVGCGEFIPPRDGAGSYSCKFNDRTCGFTCIMKCPRPINGIHLTISNKRHAREGYVCYNNVWKRRDSPKAFCKVKMPVTEVKQNLHHIHELNRLAVHLFNSSFFYLGMASFFERADVALPGFSKLMTGLWKTDLDHAREVISYVNKRGGYINFQDIPRPTSHEDLLVNLQGRPAQAGLEMAILQSQDLNQHALDLNKLSMEKSRAADPHLKLFLDDGILTEKVETIKKLSDLLSQLQAFPPEDYHVAQYSMDLKLHK